MNELLKFMTTELVTYLQIPQAERQKRREDKKEQRSTWSEQWFGTLPLALGMLVKKDKA